MKTHPLDYLLSGSVILLLILFSIFCIFFFVAPITTTLFKNYDALVNAAVFLLIYGISSSLLLQICLKINPIKAGSFTMDHAHFTYWKFITVIHEFGKGSLLPFTTIFAKPIIANLFGAKIGKNVAIAGTLIDPWLINLSDNVILGLNSSIVAHAIINDKIIMKPIVIHKGATVGVHSVVMLGTIVGENSVIVAGSVVKMNTIIPPNELWGGTPAKKIKDIEITESTVTEVIGSSSSFLEPINV